MTVLKRIKAKEPSKKISERKVDSHYKTKTIFKKIAKKVVPLLLSAGVLSLVVWKVEPPKSLFQATVAQLFFFFIPLLSLLISLINLFLKDLLKSSLISLGLVSLLVLKGLNALNPVTTTIFIATVLFTTKLFLRKLKKYNHQPRLNRDQAKIPKLSHLSKQR